MWTGNQLLDFGKDPLGRGFFEPMSKAADPLGCSCIQRQRNLRQQSQAPQHPQRISAKVFLPYCAQSPFSQVLKPTGGIHKFASWIERKSDGIQSVVPSPEVVLKAASLPCRDVDGPAFQHQPGDVTRLVQRNETAPEFPIQLSRQVKGAGANNQIEVRPGRQAIQEGIPHCPAHQSCFLRKQRQWNGPAFHGQTLSNLLRSTLAIQNDIRCGGGGHVYLCGLPLGRSMPGLSRCRTSAWCTSPDGASGSGAT